MKQILNTSGADFLVARMPGKFIISHGCFVDLDFAATLAEIVW
jgi:hypothetical protein